MQGRTHIYINGTACVSPQKTLRVLLVEDEPGVREHARRLLTSLGHRITACPDAACAEAGIAAAGLRSARAN